VKLVSASVLKVAMSGKAVYWKQGLGVPKIVDSNIVYQYNKVTKMTTIIGTGVVPFKITGMPTNLI